VNVTLRARQFWLSHKRTFRVNHKAVAVTGLLLPRAPRASSRAPTLPTPTPTPVSATDHITKSTPTAPSASSPTTPSPPPVGVCVPVRQRVDHPHAYQSAHGGPRTARTIRSGRTNAVPLLWPLLVVVVGDGDGDGDGARADVEWVSGSRKWTPDPFNRPRSSVVVRDQHSVLRSHYILYFYNSNPLFFLCDHPRAVRVE
jgi:hypothetical protein